jgi:hypothetical protein
MIILPRLDKSKRLSSKEPLNKVVHAGQTKVKGPSGLVAQSANRYFVIEAPPNESCKNANDPMRSKIEVVDELGQNYLEFRGNPLAGCRYEAEPTAFYMSEFA